jgi:hypothetical protein
MALHLLRLIPAFTGTRFRSMFRTIFLLGFFVLSPSANSQVARLSNEKVMVFEPVMAPGEILPGGRPAVVVFTAAGAIETMAPEGSRRAEVKAGDAIFVEAGVKVKDVGTTDLRFARIDFVGQGSTEQWGTAGISPRYKVLIENRYTRVYDIRIASGEKEPQHTHHDRVVICFSGAELRHLFPDGKTETSSMKTGEIAWRKGSTHVGENRGKTDFHAVAVEPK